MAKQYGYCVEVVPETLFFIKKEKIMEEKN